MIFAVFKVNKMSLFRSVMPPKIFTPTVSHSCAFLRFHFRLHDLYIVCNNTIWMIWPVTNIVIVSWSLAWTPILACVYVCVCQFIFFFCFWIFCSLLSVVSGANCYFCWFELIISIIIRDDVLFLPFFFC